MIRSLPTNWPIKRTLKHVGGEMQIGMNGGLLVKNGGVRGKEVGGGRRPANLKAFNWIPVPACPSGGEPVRGEKGIEFCGAARRAARRKEW